MAARIEGVILPQNKRVEFGLTYIYGVGLKTSQDILKRAKVDINKRCKDLTDEELASIQKELGKFVVEGELRKHIALDIRRLQEIGCYRGIRHKKGLPVRGQRTKTNARSRKGPRKAGGAIALKKKATKK